MDQSIANFAGKTVPADVLALLDAGTSAGTAMMYTPTYIYLNSTEGSTPPDLIMYIYISTTWIIVDWGDSHCQFNIKPLCKSKVIPYT